MAKPAGDNEKKRGRGRPPTEAIPILVRVMPPDVAALDAWIARQPDPKPSRPEAIRQALREWLTSTGSRPASHTALELTSEVSAKEAEIASIPDHREPSPEAGMDKMRKAVAENDLIKLRNRQTRLKRRNKTGPESG